MKTEILLKLLSENIKNTGSLFVRRIHDIEQNLKE